MERQDTLLEGNLLCKITCWSASTTTDQARTGGHALSRGCRLPAWAMAWGAQQQPSHYEVLGVAQDAAPDDIRAAYRAAVLRLHPDKAGSAAVSNGARPADAGFLIIQQAWEVRRFRMWACMFMYTC